MSIIKPISNDFDIWNEEINTDLEHTTILLKESFVDFLCRLQDEDCLVVSSRLFNVVPDEYFCSPNNPLNKNP